ncbi:MAG: hypothetical protein HY829_01780 [Actinobacteria bacterium]|nr:hypothetical protein [Actinomycetota bacterium]
MTCLALALTGCSAGAAGVSSPPSTPSAVRAAPSGTVTMAALGWKNGPSDRVLLPTAVTIVQRVDQANVITAVGEGAKAASVLATLTATLPSYGWTITASGGGSLTFSDAQHEGAFTSDASLWALTVRVKA